MKKSFKLFITFFLVVVPFVYPQSSNTTWLSSTYTYSKAFDVKVIDRYAYVVGWEENYYGNLFGSFSIVDIQVPSNPNLISSIFINDAYGIDIKDNYAFIAEGIAGLKIYNVANQFHPALIGQIILPGNAKDVKVVGNIAYVADEYAGLRIIDISNIQNPIEIGYFNSPGRSFDVEIRDTLAFLADLEGGLICLNISNPNNPEIIGTFPSSDTVVDIDLVDSLAYFTDGYAGVKVVNIANPSNIFLVDELHLPYWCLGIKVSGSYAYVAAWANGGLRIIDISNPESIKETGYYNTYGKSRDLDVVGSTVYIADWDGGGLTLINNDLINPIPVELASFTASVSENSVTLNWLTATELSNLGFEIQRQNSDDKNQNMEWTKIGFVPGFGTTTEPKSYSFIDSKLETGNYNYRLKQIDLDGSFAYSNTINIKIEQPFVFTLDQNYPNPFNPVTSIQYAIANKQFVKLIVYDVLGNEIAVLVNEEKPAGKYEVSWNASNLASGVYIYRLQSGLFVSSKKMMLLR